ncbi:MAG: RecQ family ATP-dependent DNA helicase [Bacteroidetes bacterium]|nr:RecQ family ATP-dependent DNA helicase [Bacteroidota bacterium]
MKKYWGFDTFRNLQQEIIVSVITNNNTLALLPTGGGKSICYQLPAIYFNKLCLVISPLISLMKDQVQHLLKNGIPAAAIYSGMSFNEVDRILDHAVYGKYRLLYVSPERLETDVFKARLEKLPLSLVAVDEAHCISEWGYDFRPSYLKISKLRAWFPSIPFLALTATATKEVQADILEKLELHNPQKFQKSFERQNLIYAVVYDEAKLKKIAAILNNIKGSGIVYVRTRKHAKEISDFLNMQKISSNYYHAGLNPHKRNQKQEDWMNNEFRIMVATNAFGMGIDKPNVRVVLHADLPDSLEAYYQEAGRAGRDLNKSYAIALINSNDRSELKKRIELGFPEKKEIQKVYEILCNYYQIPIGSGAYMEFDFDLNDFCKNYNLDLLNTFNSLKSLQQENMIQITENSLIYSRLMLIPTHTEIYDFQLRNPKFEPLIKTLLRSYSGLYDNYTRINENELASRLGTTKATITRYLDYLKKNSIADYIPSRTKPQIIFLMNRPTKSNFHFDYSSREKRKKIAVNKIESVVHYAFESSVCRSKILLAYFGEKSSRNCGHCDYCLKVSESGLKPEEFDKIYAKLMDLVKRKKIKSTEIHSEFKAVQKEKIIYALRWLIDQGKITEDSNLYLQMIE